ncbi:hypothetical protein C1H46_000403 [Malus baccata]|uniref:Uncharacterized protein n=1 Tax=Malus baccata TaxID=106549 RepID=A0A540NSH0_MALBA|nr:hypothetical protein C1H46_000403 [Malus baccata]
MNPRRMCLYQSRKGSFRITFNKGRPFASSIIFNLRTHESLGFVVTILCFTIENIIIAVLAYEINFKKVLKFFSGFFLGAYGFFYEVELSKWLDNKLIIFIVDDLG